MTKKEELRVIMRPNPNNFRTQRLDNIFWKKMDFSKNDRKVKTEGSKTEGGLIKKMFFWKKYSLSSIQWSTKEIFPKQVALPSCVERPLSWQLRLTVSASTTSYQRTSRSWRFFSFQLCQQVRRPTRGPPALGGYFPLDCVERPLSWQFRISLRPFQLCWKTSVLAVDFP